ncbi:MAG: guanylate kinase [Patescibacteria group bacterium]|jgi:guanylate kinase
MAKGKLFVVTGPSGAGKDSVINQVKTDGLVFAQVITTTTRSKRVIESAGKPYYFIDKAEFEDLVAKQQLIEWAEVYGNLYGCTKAEVEQKLASNNVVIVKVDPQGARAYKKMVPGAVTIFIMPPSYEYLEKRLVNRETDSSDVIKQRLQTAQRELEHLLDWDYLVVNEEGKLAEAAEEVKKIVLSTAC